MREFTTSDGARISYRVEGNQDGPALLLLQGQANSQRWWDGVRTEFESRFRTITFDYRGTGATSAPEADWTTRSFAADAAAVVREAGYSQAHVYGTSMGGRIAQWLAIDHPELVVRLVLGCTTPGGAHAVERDQQVRRSLMTPDPAERRRVLFELMYTDAWTGAPEQSTVLGDPSMTPGATRLHLRVSSRHDAWDHLPEITAPTLILHGDDDRFAPVVNADLLEQRIPGATKHVLTGARHAYFDEFREESAALVLKFLDAG
ncbi:alpha/beta fold hydrolase [Saccharopolyspora gloriosae]|uniref:alpha/beta fold hydrolase n=1 Tax=Saccharopolyspora gloriosae TaxID=455344 RepID=UPI001FB5B52D|nr:alpha/beta hydrolase [Saccharopolyspora gloriosae]